MGRISIRSVSKKYGATTALDDVDLDIEDGEFLVLLGPSGCGKSTLLRIVAGLAAPSSGQIVVNDVDITNQAPRDRDLAMVFQGYALYPHLTAAKNIGFPLRARRISKSSIADQVRNAADVLDLTAVLDRRPAELSGGQRQRVAVARAIVRDPQAFLMDEPLSNLDAILRASTRRQLIELRNTLSTTFIYVTHDQVEAMTMATRIAILRAGRIEQVGTPEQLYDQPETTFVAAFLGSPPMNLVDAAVVDRNNELYASGSGIDVPLGLSAYDGSAREVTIGIRPERIFLDGRHPAAIRSARASVSAVENLGSEVIVHARLDNQTVLVRSPRPAPAEIGDRVDLYCAPTDLHLFDRLSGRRLVWEPSHRHTATTALSYEGALK